MTQPTAKAFLALWNSISSPNLRTEYETWHSFEHVPERVGLPGFIEARRYRSINNPADYFTCYWLTSLEALATPGYRDVFTRPTPWSARMRGELRNFFRMPCELGGAYGNSSATQLVTLHLRSASDTTGGHLDSLLQQMVDRAGLVCAHWGPAQPSDDFPIANSTAISNAANVQEQAQGQDYVVMLQHLDWNTLRGSTQTLMQSLSPLTTPATAPAYFELLTQVRQDELAGPLTTRQPARPELLKNFSSGDKP